MYDIVNLAEIFRYGDEYRFYWIANNKEHIDRFCEANEFPLVVVERPHIIQVAVEEILDKYKLSYGKGFTVNTQNDCNYKVEIYNDYEHPFLQTLELNLIKVIERKLCQIAYKFSPSSMKDLSCDSFRESLRLLSFPKQGMVPISCEIIKSKVRAGKTRFTNYSKPWTGGSIDKSLYECFKSIPVIEVKYELSRRTIGVLADEEKTIDVWHNEDRYIVSKEHIAIMKQHGVKNKISL
jgi:hypothetical protein